MPLFGKGRLELVTGGTLAAGFTVGSLTLEVLGLVWTSGGGTRIGTEVDVGD